MIEEFAGKLRELVARGGPEPGEYEDLEAGFNQTAEALRRGEIAPDRLLDLWRSLGDAFASTATLQGHVVAKPYGYHGDFDLIDKIYTRFESPDPRFRRWDAFFQSRAAAEAVRSRKAYCVRLATQLARARRGDAYRMLSAACGPARDVYEILSREDHVVADCLDRDPAALEYARKLTAPFASRVRLMRRNIVRFHAPPEYDLVWAAGIFDYLSDRTFVATLARLADMLRAGGRLVVANFGEDNPSRAYMECGLWFLEHRSRDKLAALAAASNIPPQRFYVEGDGGGIVNYLHVLAAQP